ncbi:MULTISPECIES: acyltransferase family protein [Pseudomonadaceae]|uniref:acyltransferase family protein n=1 Tax=Pseudomonadaceae TaxID=135621 RepID=UPI0015E439B8|nr:MULTISPECIES: acyltransferase [Pseudomonadaceae]MBA1276919.1 acyltransferase [Stutzerimonas stutzeri]MBC8651155.1 acyltransferase [Pseudomonas sp. MT4]QXY93374.1 acyltransferase [Pseudomonas sp. MTM4]
MPYSPALDGLRAVAILLVLLFHGRMPGLPGANVGVDIFFVLSGYLITRILLAEHQASGAVDLRRFYRQRLWRLTPPLLLLLLLYALFAPLLWPDYYFHIRDWIVVLIYQADLALVFGMGPQMMLHAWSLGIEERFYLLWPPALLGLMALRNLRVALTLLLAGIALLGLWRMTALQIGGVGSVEAYYRFDMRISGLLLGACLGMWIGNKLPVPEQLLRRHWLVLAWLVLLAVMLYPTDDKGRLSFGLPLVEVTVLYILLWLHCRPHGLLGKMLAWRALVYVGQLSYGLYLFHYPAMEYLKLQHLWWLTLLAGTAVAFVLAMFSHHLIEQPIRRWRKRPTSTPVSLP